MKAAIPAYPAYQNTGLPWASKVPAHWDMERAKALFKKLQLPVGPTDDVVTCFRDGVVTLRKNRRTSGFTEAIHEFGYQGVRRGNLVIHAMDAFAGAIGVSDADGKCTPIYAICEPKPYVNAHYYAHLVREMARTQYILALSRGIRERSTDFRYEMFATQSFPVPPPEEQDAIVRFVRHLDLRVNRLLKTKRRLIELLNEQKQAIIHRAVTRGLYPDVALKPSGVEWLGDVPAHWLVIKLKQAAAIALSNVDKKSVEGEVKVRLCNYTDVYYNSEITGAINFMEATASSDQAKRFQLRIGDVLITKDSETPDDIAVPAVVTEELEGVVCGYHLAMLRPKTLIHGNYLAHVLANSPSKDHFHTSAHGVTRYGLSLNGIGTASILLPPVAEQKEIVAYIASETAPFDKAITKAKSEIDFIREYRTRLVSDVVTGQLDVRGLALPEIADMTASLSDVAEDGDGLPGEEPEGDNE